MPADEADVSPDLVRRLLAAQQPDLAHLPIEVMANGWDNLMCRLGAELVVRLPRRAVAAELITHEQRWLPALAPRRPRTLRPTPTAASRSRTAARRTWRTCALGGLVDPQGRAACMGGRRRNPEVARPARVAAR